MPTVSDIRHPVGGVVQAEDDGSGIILLGETVSMSTVLIVQGVDGVGVTGSKPTDTSREGNGRETSLGDHGPWRRSMHL